MSKISRQYRIFAPSDGPPRGTGHGEWLKMQIKNKYIRGEASKKVSKTEACILRNQAKSEGHATETKGTSTHRELTTTTDDETNSYKFFHAGNICDLFDLAYQRTHLPVHTAQHALS